jgi:D-amino peptidase
MDPVMRMLSVLLLYCCLAFGAGERILIVTDLEGVGGVWDAEEQLLPGQRRYPESRKLLTGEVNAAVEGLVQAGAKEIVIWDGHDGSRTLSIDEIHPAARLLQGRPTPATYYMSDKLYDGIIFVGQHARAGAPNSILAHSQSFNVRKIAINGTEVGEVGQVAAIAGYFGIPVIMLAGDRAACEELAGLQRGAVTVPVKQLGGKASAISLSHGEACRQIREAAQKAVRRVREFQPWKIGGPVEMTIEMKDGKVSSYRGATVLSAFQEWLGK